MGHFFSFMCFKTAYPFYSLFHLISQIIIYLGVVSKKHLFSYLAFAARAVRVINCIFFVMFFLHSPHFEFVFAKHPSW